MSNTGDTTALSRKAANACLLFAALLYLSGCVGIPLMMRNSANQGQARGPESGLVMFGAICVIVVVATVCLICSDRIRAGSRAATVVALLLTFPVVGLTVLSGFLKLLDFASAQDAPAGLMPWLFFRLGIVLAFLTVLWAIIRRLFKMVSATKQAVK